MGLMSLTLGQYQRLNCVICGRQIAGDATKHGLHSEDTQRAVSQLQDNDPFAICPKCGQVTRDKRKIKLIQKLLDGK